MKNIDIQKLILVFAPSENMTLLQMKVMLRQVGNMLTLIENPRALSSDDKEEAREYLASYTLALSPPLEEESPSAEAAPEPEVTTPEIPLSRNKKKGKPFGKKF